MGAISVTGLTKSYGDNVALAGVNFEVGAGETVAILGPNGAGKTTTVEILEGFRSRDEGQVSVLGEDPEKAARSWRARLGLVLQATSLDEQLTVREELGLYGGMYPNPRSVEEVMELVSLAEEADRRIGTLSGGQKRRVDLGLAIVGNPEMLFLDEPTTGFDPAARRAAWETIELQCDGRTRKRRPFPGSGGGRATDAPSGRRSAGKRLGDPQDRRSCADTRGVARLGAGVEGKPGPADGEPVHPRRRLHGTHRRRGQRRETS